MNRLLFMTTVSAVGVFAFGPAFAQTGSSKVEEVIVTAQKRSENLQAVPLAVTAVGGDTLQAHGVVDAKGLSDIVPGVKIQGVNQPAVFVRGVGTSNSSSTGDQGVAIHLDGVFHARPTAFAAALFDIDHIEVLKGPQGTLYGRGALGGNINVISRAPTQDFGGAFNVQGGDHNLIHLDGALNLPLTDKSAARVALESERHDGYSSNGTDDADNIAGRIRYVYRPTDSLTLGLEGFYTQELGKGNGAHLARAYASYPLSENPWDSSIPGSLYGLNERTREVSASANWNLGLATLTYIPGYVQSYIAATAPTLTAGASGPTFTSSFSETKSNMTSHEIRLASPAGQRLEWTGGLYYMDEKVRYQVANRAQYGQIETTSESAFGQGGLTLVDKFKLIGGFRVTSESKVQKNSFGFTYRNTWRPVTGKVGFEYTPSDQSMLYFTVADGFKSGGFFTAPGPNTFNPETVRTYELGSKNRFLDGRLQANGSIFLYKYDGYTVNLTVPGYNGTNGQGVFNAGKVTVKGFDLDTIFRVTTTDRLEGSVAYTDGKFDSFSVATTSGKAGDAVPYDPLWSANAAYEHTFDLNQAGELRARLETHFETATWLSANHRAYTGQGSYTKSTAMATWAPESSRFTIALWVRNIENRAVKLTVSDTLNLETYNLAPPRTFGVSFAGKF